MNPRIPNSPEDDSQCAQEYSDAQSSDFEYDNDPLSAAVAWLERLRTEPASDQLIEEWVGWSSNPDNLSAFERLKAIGLAAKMAKLQPNDLSDYVGLGLLLARHCRDHKLAANMVNDAVRTTWEMWGEGQIQRPEQIAGYIFRTAMDLLRNHMKGGESRSEVQESSKVSGDTKSADEMCGTGVTHLSHRLEEILHSMQRDRAVLVPFHLKEENAEIICRDLKLDA